MPTTPNKKKTSPSSSSSSSSIAAASKSSSSCSSSPALHTPDVLLIIFSFLPLGDPLPESQLPFYSVIPLVCKDWHAVTKREEFWVLVMQTEAPHLLRALQQHAQHSTGALQHPWSSAQASFRQWRESRIRANRNDDLKEDEQKKKIRARLQGSSIVVAFFMRPDDKEAMAQVILPCDDEEKMTEFFTGNYDGDGVMLQKNESVNFFDYDYDHWDDGEDIEGSYEWDEKLRPTRVLIYILDAQRGTILNLLQGSPQGDTSMPCPTYAGEFYISEPELRVKIRCEPYAVATRGITLTAYTTFFRPERTGEAPKINVVGMFEQGDDRLDSKDDAYSLLYMMLESAALYD